MNARTAEPERWCHWCPQAGRGLTVAGLIRQGSRPGKVLYACTPCVEEHGIVPLDRHPPDTDGRPRYKQAVAPQH